MIPMSDHSLNTPDSSMSDLTSVSSASSSPTPTSVSGRDSTPVPSQEGEFRGTPSPSVFSGRYYKPLIDVAKANGIIEVGEDDFERALLRIREVAMTTTALKLNNVSLSTADFSLIASEFP